MSKKREFTVWVFWKEGSGNNVTYEKKKNWRQAIRYAKRILRCKDVRQVDISVE